MSEEVKQGNLEARLAAAADLVAKLRTKTRSMRYELGRSNLAPGARGGIARTIDALDDALIVAEKKFRHLQEVMRDN